MNTKQIQSYFQKELPYTVAIDYDDMMNLYGAYAVSITKYVLCSTLILHPSEQSAKDALQLAIKGLL